MNETELDRERRYVAKLYERLDQLSDEARGQLAAIHRLDVGGHHQNRSERDAFARMYEDRIAQLSSVAQRLAFGRLELQQTEGGAPVHRYIGRIGLRDANLQPILLDWRVPQASAFYQATAATPLGIRARRHLISQGRKLVRIDDEIFDSSLLDGDTSNLQGEAALLATLTAGRTGRMTDIVATIQAEQDRIIRSDLRGILVVQGGPGTGKTAVALHRAAYLLYSHRDRLRSAGVLVVGPSKSFLHYIEAVLPSLGESGVVLSSVGGLFPGIDATRDDDPAVAAIKGQARMADLIARAVKSRQKVPAEAQTVIVNGDAIRLEPELIASAIAKAQQTGKPHNEARVTFVKSALNQLVRIYAAQLRDQGNSIDDDDLAMLREDLRAAEDVRIALNTAWLPLTAEKLVQDLWARPSWLAELTTDFTPRERQLLQRPRSSAFTISDIPLLDEAAELLGEFNAVDVARKREEQQQHERDVENAQQAIQNMGVAGLVDAEELAYSFAEVSARATTAERAAADRTWAYGHIVVDEAQELSPMQWRLLLRRCPIRSFTIVGDIAQSSAAAAAEDWPGALATLIARRPAGQRWRLEELTVNYRTPAQIAASAEAMALAHSLPVTRSQAVRQTEWPVAVHRVDRSAVAGTVIGLLNQELSIDTAGTVAVIVRDRSVTELHRALARHFQGDIGLNGDDLTKRITVLSPEEAKGLEFDAVIVVEPGAIVADSSRGASALYVAMTRPTQRLYLVAAEDLPAGIVAEAASPPAT